MAEEKKNDIWFTPNYGLIAAVLLMTVMLAGLIFITFMLKVEVENVDHTLKYQVDTMKAAAKEEGGEEVLTRMSNVTSYTFWLDGVKYTFGLDEAVNY